MTETGAAGYGIEYLPLAGARKLWERYRRFFLYMEETRHNWQLSRTVGYADGTTESVYVSQLTGETRIK